VRKDVELTDKEQTLIEEAVRKDVKPVDPDPMSYLRVSTNPSFCRLFFLCEPDSMVVVLDRASFAVWRGDRLRFTSPGLASAVEKVIAAHGLFDPDTGNHYRARLMIGAGLLEPDADIPQHPTDEDLRKMIRDWDRQRSKTGRASSPEE
jgi:hypothetical protein